MSSLRIVLIVLAIVSSTTLAGAAPDAEQSRAIQRGGPRVRPHDSRSAALLLEGMNRSARLRTLIDRLEQHDVIVYVEMQPALRGRLSGSLTWLTRTPQFRYVRVSVNPTLSTELAIATVGHELQHALEVALEKSVVDTATLESHYRRIGMSVGLHMNGFDTDAARIAGDEVRRDLANVRGGRALESIQHFDSQDWHIVYRQARESTR